MNYFRIAAAFLALSLVGSLSSGCASWQIRSAESTPVGIGGQAFSYPYLSIAGRQGASSADTGYTTREECRSADLADVEVRRDIDDTLVTFLTLGVVSPATVYFYCAKPPITPPCDCEDDSGDVL